MVRIHTTLAGCLLGVMVAGMGCSGNPMSSQDIQKQIARNEAWALSGEKKPGYYEFAHDGKMYVVGYPETEAAVKSGKKLQSFRKGIGYGPNGETVTFEENKVGLADILIERYEAKHKKAKA